MEHDSDLLRDAPPEALARLIAFQAADAGACRPEELGQILRDHLAATVNGGQTEGRGGDRKVTLAEQLLGTNVSEGLLRRLRESAARCRTDPLEGPGLPPEVATLLCHAASAAALVHRGRRIDDSDDQALRRAWAWAAEQAWADAGLRELFRAGLDLLAPADAAGPPDLCLSDTSLPPVGALDDGPSELVGEAAAGSGDGSGEMLPEVGGFEVLSKLGEGGGGTVWRAVQLGTRRPVALKLTAAAPFSRRARGRFEREVELASRLDHPSIARVYDSGVHRGQFYCAMELVEGTHLDQYVRNKGLSRRQVLGLMREVCLAVQHAHLRGVIHRDLKPSNILVTDEGTPKVLDFGLARALDGGPSRTGSAVTVTLTAAGQCAGTPAFMSPEQAVGETDRADTRTDVYALGSTLHYLLLGRPAHDASGPRHELLRRIANEEVPPPRKLCRDLDPDLEAVLLKALTRDPDRRYATAGELAQDIESYLRGEPLMARPPGSGALLWKHLRRHRGKLAAAATVVVVLATMAVWAYVRVDLARRNALADRSKAERSAAEADRQRRLGEMRLADATVGDGDAQGTRGRWMEAFGRYSEAQAIYARLGAAADLADLALGEAYEHARPPLVRLVGHEGTIRCIDLSPGERLAATGGEDGAVRLWDVRTGRPLHTLRGHGGAVLCVAFGPDGRRLLSGGKDQTLRLWEASTGRCLRVLTGHTCQVEGVAFSPDGSRAASAGASWGDACRVWDLESGRELRASPSAGDRCVAFSPDGRSLARGLVGCVLVQDAETGRERCRADTWPDAPTTICYSADGRLLAVGTMGRRVRLFNAATGRLVRELGDCGSIVRRIGFSPDGRRAFGAGWGGAMIVWAVDSGKEVARASALAAAESAAWSTSGEWVVTGGPDGVAAVWDLRPAAEVTVLGGHEAGVAGVALSPDGRLAASASRDGGVRLFDTATGRLLRQWPHANWRSTVAFSPDGRKLAAGGQYVRDPHDPDHPDNGRDDRVYVWDVAGGRELLRLGGHEGNVVGFCFSPDGSKLFTVCNAEAKLFDAEQGELLWAVAAGSVLAGGAAFSPDGRLALGAGVHGFGAAVEVETGRVVAVTPERSKWGRVSSRVGFLSDGRTAFCTVDSVGLALWDIATGRMVRPMQASSHDWIRAAAVLRDGRRGLSAGHDGAVRLWDLSTGRPLRAFGGHTEGVCSLASSADGKVFVSGSEDRTCRVRDLSRPAEYRAFEPKLEDARPGLSADPEDPAALSTLGQWYAFRGHWAWAADLLDRAKANGAEVPALTLARCRWNGGDLAGAAEAFEAARSAGAAPAAYLDACLAAVRRDSLPPVQAGEHP